VANPRAAERDDNGISRVIVRDLCDQLYGSACSRRCTGDIRGPPDEGRIAFVSLRGSQTGTSDDDDHARSLASRVAVGQLQFDHPVCPGGTFGL
jgi:hypothetical protein